MRVFEAFWSRRRASGVVLGLLVSAVVAASCGDDEGGDGAAALAEGFPSKAVTMISPFAHGSTNDQVSRMLADFLTESTGQTVTVTNVEGASGMTGALRAIKAPADGYTLWVDSLSTSAALFASFESLPFKLDERTQISQLATQYQYFIVPDDSDFQTLDDAIESARSNPADFSWAAGAAGSAPMYAQLQLLQAGDVAINKTKRIIFPTGLAAASTAVASGEVMFGISAGPQLAQLLAAKKIRVLAVAAEERTEEHPDVPTAAELGYEGVNLDIFNSLAGPPDLPAPIVEFWRGKVEEWGSSPEVQSTAKESFVNLATERDGDQIRQYIQDQYDALLPLAEQSGVRQ